MALAMLLPSQADNYFTMGVNDTLRIRPSYLDGFLIVPVKMHTDGRMNNWSISLTYPTGLHPQDGTLVTGVIPGTDLSVTYKNYYNRDTVYNATLTVSTNFIAVASSIPVIGYYDYNHDGVMDPYGTVKWEAGDYYDMFSFRFAISSTFRGDTVTFVNYFSSDPDQRQGLINPNPFYSCKDVYVYVGYKKGDVNGDENVNQTDVSLLINYMNNPNLYDFDEFQLAASDMNGDGNVNITDVTMLVNYIMSL